jgi:hypothetical protein
MNIRNLVCLMFVLMLAGVGFAIPYATEVVSYVQGSNCASIWGGENYDEIIGYYNNTSAVLGALGTDAGFGADVSPFAPVWSSDKLLSIGAGGSVVVKFDHQVVNNVAGVNYGMDFIMFGNVRYNDNGLRQTDEEGSLYGAELGTIEVSQNGIVWYNISVANASIFPTMAYTDSTLLYDEDWGTYNEVGGSTVSDFTIPVDPFFDASNKDMAGLQAGYAGSGGGTAFDIASTGLDWIQYVRVSQDSSDEWSNEIDAFADVVPEPCTIALFGLGGLLLRRRRN